MARPDATKWANRRFLVVLGLPAFGLALSYTLVTTYLPVLIERLTGPTLTGVMIGGEGALALFVPIMVGSWSDATSTRIGARMPFVLVGAACAVIGLLVIPLNIGSLAGIGLGLVLFFVGYFFYQSPYYALFPDLVPDSQRGRSQGVQGGLRSLGLLLSLSVGGVLLNLWHPAPFLTGAVAITAVTAVLYHSLRLRFRQHLPAESRSHRSAWAAEWDLVARDRDIRRWAVANSLWEAALGGLRVFVVLYFIRGLDLSLPQVSGALTLVGLAAVVAAPVAGRLADRSGHRPVMLTALWVFALGLIIPVLTTNRYFILGIVPVAFAAVVLLTLPYSVLMGLLPQRERHGIGAGLFGFSRGIGIVIGPLVAGAAVELSGDWQFLTFAATDGYAAVFAVTSVLLLASIPVMSGMNKQRPVRGDRGPPHDGRSVE